MACAVDGCNLRERPFEGLWAQRTTNDTLHHVESMMSELGPNRDRVIIFFGGIRGGMGIEVPPFEFVKTTKYASYCRLFLRDVFGIWYHRGLAGHTNDIDETIELLSSDIKERGFREVVCVGNSAGGFAAILFGVGIGTDLVHAFSPQTFLDKWRMLRHRDLRWIRSLASLYVLRTQRKVLDLNSVLSSNQVTKCVMHFCAGSRLDRIHVNHVARNRNVQLLGYPCSDHSVVKHLRDRGFLSKVIEVEASDRLQRLHRRLLDEWNACA